MLKQTVIKVASIGLVLVMGILLTVGPAKANHSSIFDYYGTWLDATCRYSILNFNFLLHGVVDDGGNNDHFVVTSTDSNGTPLDAGNIDATPGPPVIRSYGVTIGWLNEPTTSTVTLKLWDIATDSGPFSGTQALYDYAFANGAPVLTFTFDVKTVDGGFFTPVCGYLPSGPVVPIDDRINWDAVSGPVALYCDEDILKVYNVNADTGAGHLLYTWSDWPADAPPSNSLLHESGGVELWQLTSGEFQVNADGGEGKTYAFVFNGCPYNGGGYNANVDP